MKKYEDYTTIDFLEDDFFKESVLYPTKESDSFWDNLVTNHRIKGDEYAEAILILKNLQPNVDNIDDEQSLKLWHRLLTSSKAIKQKHTIRKYLYVASTAVACIFVAIVLHKKLSISQENTLRQIAETSSVQKTDTSTNIQLFLGYQKIDLDGNSANIDYQSNDSVKVNDQQLRKEEGTYNQIVVPYGKRSFLVLDDGSRIWINAGSHVVYPTKFSSSKRIIFVKGEVYAEIEKDVKRPFLIISDNLNVEVLGTSFNISDYSSNNASSIVLVEGSVKVKSNDSSNKNTSILKPNEMYTYAEQRSTVQTVDVSDYIAWKKGLYNFKNKRLGEVLKVIKKYYNIEIECSEQAAAILCSGSLDLKEDVNQVITGVSYAASVDFRNNENKYTIFSP